MWPRLGAARVAGWPPARRLGLPSSFAFLVPGRRLDQGCSTTGGFGEAGVVVRQSMFPALEIGA